MIPVHFFVYGTLRSDCGAMHGGLLRANFTRLGLGRMRGALFEVGGYPGLRVDLAPAGAEPQWVVGELYRLEGEESVFETLDDYEECCARFAPPHEYARWLLPVRFGGRDIPAYVYCYQRPVNEARRIRSGDYRVFLAQQAAPMKKQEAPASCFFDLPLNRA